MTKKEKIMLGLGITVLVVIFISSSMTYQQQSIKDELKPSFAWLKNFLNQLEIHYAGHVYSVAQDGYGGFMEFILRKSAHFGSYFLMGGSFYYAFRKFIHIKVLPEVLIFFATVGLAAFDEFHQAITGGRTPSVYDVMLDGAGAFLGIFLVLVVSLLVNNFKQKKLQEN